MILSLNILFIALLQTSQVFGEAAVGLYKNCISNLGVNVKPINRTATLIDSMPAFTECLDTFIQPTDLASCKAVDNEIFMDCMDKQCLGSEINNDCADKLCASRFGDCPIQKCPRELFNTQVISYICHDKYPVASPIGPPPADSPIGPARKEPRKPRLSSF